MIKGVTDRPRNFFPRIAKIRLGVKRTGQGGSEYPSDTDYFVLTDAPEVAKVYGDKPKRLVAMFPSNDQEEIFPTRLEAWKSSKGGKSKLFCNSDGETASRIYVGDRDVQGHAIVKTMPEDERPDVGELFTMPCPHEECPFFDNRSCRRVGRLNIVLPEVTLTGTYQIETSSMWGFGNILDMIEWIRKMTRWSGMPLGDFAWKVPFELTRRPQQMTPPGMEGKTVIKHVLALSVIDDDARLAELNLKVPAWIKERKLLVEKATDRPEDLFPEENGTRALPPVPDQVVSAPQAPPAQPARPSRAAQPVVIEADEPPHDDGTLDDVSFFLGPNDGKPSQPVEPTPPVPTPQEVARERQAPPAQPKPKPAAPPPAKKRGNPLDF